MPRGTSTSTEDTERQVNAEKNTGSQMLKALRSREAEKRDEELRKVRELRETDALVAQEGAQAQAIPERVAQRMGKRMLPFVGIPLFGSFASFIGFWYLATQKDMEFQPAVVATTSFVFLAIGLLVSYIKCIYLHKHIASVSYFFFLGFYTMFILCVTRTHVVYLDLGINCAQFNVHNTKKRFQCII